MTTVKVIIAVLVLQPVMLLVGVWLGARLTRKAIRETLERR